MTGPLEEAEIARIVQAYAEPSCYGEAAEALAADRVIVLSGPAGSGRRAGAITILDRATAPGKPLVGLSPAITVERLAQRYFEEDAGYLVNDMFDDEFVPEVANFHWRNICRNIRKSRAFLVVTVGADSQIARSSAVRHISWHRPETVNVLRAHLGAMVIDDKTIDRVAEVLGAEYPLNEIGAVARQIATADDIEEALAELQDASHVAVASWLDEADREIPAVVEVAALAFVLGVSERIFEAELTALKARMAEFAPGTDTKSKKARAEIDLRFQQLRKHRVGHPLLTVRYVPVARRSGSLAIRHVDFRMPMYRVYFIAELWNRVGTEFWNAIRGWLHGIVAYGNADLVNSIAGGLALLGLEAPDEVIDSYLEPWTSGKANSNELATAVYVVWQMSMLDQLAPLALQIAIHWAGQGTRMQRRAAAYALSGELGARYPIEAVKRLTQLAEQGEELARQAHAQLFATLAEQDNDAAVVLLEMRRRMNKKTDRPSADLVSDAVVGLLSIRSPRSGRPSAAVFLLANPLRAADIAPLWAQMLCRRPWRDRAIAALLRVIGAIEHGHADPDALVRSLGSAIGEELPSGERASVRADLIAAARGKDGKRRASEDQDSSSGPQVSGSLLETFLTACESPFQKEVS